MRQPLFDIDIPSMQVEVNSYKAGRGLAWATLFPLKYAPRFDLKGLEGNEGIPVAANRVAFNTQAPLKTRRTIGSWSGKLGKIAMAKQKNEIEINEYNDLKASAAANTTDKALAQYLVDLVYDDVKACDEGINYKLEIDALRIASSGKHTFPAEIEGDMATADEIDFNIPSANFGGVKAAWSAATADGLADIVKMQKKIAKTGAAKPRYAFMEQAAFDLLCGQTATANKLFPQAKDLSLVTGDMISLQSINAYMLSHGYPQIVVIDSYATIEDKAGNHSTIKPWAENVVVLAPEQTLGYTYYKPVPVVPNTDAMQVQSQFYKVTRYSDLNPMLEVTMAEAYVQPAIKNRASTAFLNINKTTWSNGAAE